MSRVRGSGAMWALLVLFCYDRDRVEREERRVTGDQTLVRGTGGCNEGHLVTEQGIEIYQSI